MHLDAVHATFSWPQKLIRRLAPPLVQIPLPLDRPLGTLGATGDLDGRAPHLHLQLFLRGGALPDRVLNPESALGMIWQENASASCQHAEDILAFIATHRKQLGFWTELLHQGDDTGKAKEQS